MARSCAKPIGGLTVASDDGETPTKWPLRSTHIARSFSLSKAHRAFATRNYKVVSVEPYIENGDLQGFFVSYQKP